MLQVTPIVFVVDDDVSVRESLELLIRCEGRQPETFASAQQFLDHPRAPVPSCLILDISLPGYIAVARDEDDRHIPAATSLWMSRPVIPTPTTGYGVGVSGR
jgi:DNA-binding NtrC family response regulator